MDADRLFLSINGVVKDRAQRTVLNADSETMITINLTTNVTYLVNCWVINFNNINVLSLSNSTKLVSEVIE